MSMTNSIVYMASILLFSVGALGAEGAGSSGGGVGVICRDASGEITKSTILDLHEQSVYSEMKSPSGDIRTDYKRLFANLRYSTNDTRPVTNQDLDFFDHMLSKQVKFVDKKLSLTNDYGEIRAEIPKGCRLEQIAIGVGSQLSSKYFINKELWNSLDSLNQASLLIHEYIYTIFRDSANQRDSHKLRKIIGMMASLKGLENMYAGAVVNKSIICTAKKTMHDSSVTELIFTNDIKKNKTTVLIPKYFGMLTFSTQSYQFQNFDWPSLKAVPGHEVHPILLPVRLDQVYVPENSSAKTIGTMYVGYNILRGEKFSIEYYKGRPLIFAKLDERHEPKDIAFVTSCKIYTGHNYPL